MTCLSSSSNPINQRKKIKNIKINKPAINKVIKVWKDIIKGFTFIIIKYTIIELKNGFRMLKLRGCSLNKYQTWIKRIPPKKSIEAKVATAAPIPAYRGIKIMFKIDIINRRSAATGWCKA